MSAGLLARKAGEHATHESAQRFAEPTEQLSVDVKKEIARLTTEGKSTGSRPAGEQGYAALST